VTKENNKFLDDIFISTGKAATICCVTPDTILKWIKKDKLKAVRTAGGHFRIKASSLSLFLSPYKTDNESHTD
jgi:excisionase family DNA binding protein